MQQMRAIAVTPGVPHSARLIQMPLPVPGAGEVRVRVIRVGIDGTDAEIDRAEYGQAPPGSNELVIGHESFGVVDSVGEGVTELAPGDFVVALVRRPDDCHYCQAGEQDLCVHGDYTERGIKGRHGFLSDYYVESPRYLVKIPAKLRDAGVMLEPLSVVEKGIRHSWAAQQRMADWKPERALILGAGPIGLMAAMICRIKGLDTTVYALDPNPDITRRIEAIGARYVPQRNEKRETVVELDQLPRMHGPFDFILECTGSAQVAFGAMHLLGLNGVLCLTSVTGGETTLEVCASCLNLDLVLGNRMILGSVNANRIDFENGVRHLAAAQKMWPGWLESLITRRVPMERFRETFERQRGDMKVVVEL